MSEWSDHLDEVLDDALTSYCKAPENEGLEQRILARVNSRAIRARRMRLLGPAMGTAAVAAWCVCWWVTPKVAVQTQQASKTALVLKKPESLQERKTPLHNTESVLMIAKMPRRSHKQRAEPKLPQFPSVRPVRSEERALLQLAKYNSEHTTQELSYLGSPVRPIQLAAVEIKPIE